MENEIDRDPPARNLLSVWLPRLATDALLRQRPAARGEAVAVVQAGRHGLTVVAVNGRGERQGIVPGMNLADARAVLPGLTALDADPAAAAALLERLADWCHRFTPLAAVDGPDGLILDVTGCTHLFGGAPALLRRLETALARGGCGARTAVAPTPAAAWALARFGARRQVAGESGLSRVLASLPVAALRLDESIVAGLHRVGLRRIADLTAMPRAALGRRYGRAVCTRLDQALGLLDEPISPRRPAAAQTARLAFPDPIATPEAIAAALDHLLAALCARLEPAGLGVRRLVLAVHRVDAAADQPPQELTVGTGRPVRAAARLRRLFATRLEQVSPGLGIEVMVLTAAVTEPLPPSQAGFDGTGRGTDAQDQEADLIDRLVNRFGRDALTRPVLRESWVPEQAVAWVPGGEVPPAGGRRLDRPRPVRLCPVPEPVEVTAPVPDDPPVLFRWRNRLVRVERAAGPERITPEWWCAPPAAETRDYYQVEDTDGWRYWLFRAGPYRPGVAPRWFLHGFFA